MPKLSLMTLARGARQLVVQEALLRGRDGESVVIHTNYNNAPAMKSAAAASASASSGGLECASSKLTADMTQTDNLDSE